MSGFCSEESSRHQSATELQYENRFTCQARNEIWERAGRESSTLASSTLVGFKLVPFIASRTMGVIESACSLERMRGIWTTL
jgi:hypothetical protein